MAIVMSPWLYVADPAKGRPVFNGDIYIGQPDAVDPITDPKDATFIQEDGTRVPVAYPIETGAGGVPLYNGSPVAIDVIGDYSILILDSFGGQKYYFANAGEQTEFVVTDLRSIMFDLCLTYDDIGTTLITDAEGTSLDDAQWILDLEVGTVWKVPLGIPPASTVVDITGNILTTNVGQFNLTSTKCEVAPNLIKTSRLVVQGVDGEPLPTNGVNANYLTGVEVAFGCVAGTDITNLTNDAVGDIGNWTADSGEIYFEVGIGPGRTIGDYLGSVMQADGTQLYADDTPGITLTENSGKARLTVDFAQVSFSVWGISEQRGKLEYLEKDRIILDMQSDLIAARTRQDVTSSRMDGVAYTNDTDTPIEIFVTTTNSNPISTLRLRINSQTVKRAGLSNISDVSLTNGIVVYPSETYEALVSGSAGAGIAAWFELRI